MESNEYTVLVTGFGPFRHYNTNPSWELAKSFTSCNSSCNGKNVKFITYELPVEYSTVDRLVPELIESYKPLIAVHCGVSNLVECLTVEQLARKSGYSKNDISCATPCGECCQCPSRDDSQLPQELWTRFDVSALCKAVADGSSLSESNCPFSITLSTDAGLYLCEYCYFTSLAVSNRWSLFVHVPDYHELEKGSKLLNEWHHQLLLLIKEAINQRVGRTA